MYLYFCAHIMTRQLSDKNLLGLLKEDDHKAYTELANRYRENLVRHVEIKIKSTEDAQDIVQEIFMSLWKNRAHIQCDQQGLLSSYLFKAVKYSVINYFSRPGITIVGEEVLNQMLSYPSAIKSDTKILIKELRGVVDMAINELPKRQVASYRLSREQHMSIKEIAVHLSVSEQTVKNNISTVLQRIHVKLKQYNADSIILILSIASVIYNK